MAIHDGDDLKKVRLKIPVSLDDIAKLEPGQIVFLDGVVYTGRERRISDAPKQFG
jgi:tartrate dehydratase beta subunit/fumarate hydratase class I family protein